MMSRALIMASGLAVAGTMPALANDAAMAGAFRAACVDGAGNLGAVAQAWSGMTGVPVSDIGIDTHPEKGFRSIFSPLDQVAGATGNERFTLYAHAADEKAAIAYCMISNGATRSPDAQLAVLVETLGLEPDTATQQRPLSEAEVMLGIDARDGEQLWTSPQLPGARIRTNLTPADPTAKPDAGAEFDPANPLATPVLASPFGSVYFEISYDLASAS